LEVKSVSFNSLYSLNDAQIDNNNGKLKLYSTMNSAVNSFKGNERLATIKIKGFKTGEGKLSFVCQQDKTADDSNIWKKGGGDIVDCGALKEGVYKIKSNCNVPQVPVNPQAQTSPEEGQVILKWDKVDNAGYYYISYGPSSLNYQWGAPNVGNVDNYVVKGLNPGKPYYFIILAHNKCGSSGALQEVAAYAGKAENKKKGYWQEPEVVYLPEDKLPLVEESSPSAELKQTIKTTASPSPSIKPSAFKGFFKGLKLTKNWLWFGLIALFLFILTIVGKKISLKENKDSLKELKPVPTEKLKEEDLFLSNSEDKPQKQI